MLTLVLGGLSSGKSRFAIELAGQESGEVLFIATGRASDREMQQRIEAHRRERPSQWLLAEEPLALDPAAGAHPAARTVLIDSIDGWLANQLEAAGGGATAWERDQLLAVENECSAVLQRLGRTFPQVICVSSEVGHSLVPLHPYGRAFADLLGRVNQRLAAMAARRYFIVAGCPIQLPNHAQQGVDDVHSQEPHPSPGV
jgi:adenosylcobinamide kinase / adenosylcobinamide-phosphate guanylyltransferase